MLLFAAAGFAACEKKGGPDDPAKPQEQTYTLSQSELTLERGASYQLTVSPMPTNKEVKWASDNETVATVSSYGEVRAEAVGTAAISVTIDDNKYECSVTVTEMTVRSAYIAFPKYSANVPKGTSETFSASLDLDGEGDKGEKVTWSVTGSSAGVISAEDYAFDGNTISLHYNNVGTVTVTARYREAEASYIVNVFPTDRQALAAPQNLKVEEEVVEWEPVANAVRYGVRIENYPEEIVTGTSFTNSEVLREYGEYKVSVRAIASATGEYIDSAYTEPVKVLCKYMMLWESTDTDQRSYITFTPAQGEVTEYNLFVDGEKGPAVQPDEKIDIAPYGDKTLQIVAVMQDGTTQKTRTVSCVNDDLTTFGSPYGGKGVSPYLDKETVPAGSTSTAMRFFVYPSSDSSYDISIQNEKFKDIKRGTVVSYRVYITGITSNDYSNRADNWEDGKTEETALPLTYLVSYGAVWVPGAGDTLQNDTWYTVYTTASENTQEGAIRLFSYLGQYRQGKQYSYTMYIDRICVGVRLLGSSDPEYKTTYAYINGADNNKVTGNTDAEYCCGDSTASIKISTRSAGSSPFTNFYLVNEEYNFKTGDTITFYFRVENLSEFTGTGAARDDDNNYTALSSLHVKGLLNPYGSWSTLNQNGTSTTGFYTVTNMAGEEVTSVTEGEWYKLTWIATYDYETEGGFKLGTHYSFAKGDSYITDLVVKYDMYIDGFSVTQNA